MKFRRKLLVLLLTLCVICVPFALSACGLPNSGGGSTATATETLTLNVNKKKLTLGDTFALIASYDKKVGVSLSWDSSNKEVATVRNGVVSAMTEGETTITATYGTLSATCAVTVSANGILPTLAFGYDTENVQVNTKSEASLAANVSFNGKVVTDGKVTYSSSNPSVGTIDANGKFTPLATGETEITIVGSWRGIDSPQLQKTFTVTVVSYRAIIVNGGEVSALSLYTVEKLAGNTYLKSKTLSIVGQEDDDAKQCTVEVLNNDGVISWNEQTKTVTGLKQGNAEIKISYTCKDNSEFSVTIPVSVTRPVTNYGKTIKLFSAMDGDLPVKDIFGYDTEIISAEQEDNKNIVVENGKVLGVNLTNKNDISNEVITVYDSSVGYRLKLEAYAKVIYDAEDLRVFEQGSDKSSLKKIEGYFVLGSNVVDTEHVYNQRAISYYAGDEEIGSKVQNAENYWYQYGFAGTFDGRGYYVTYTCVNGLFNQFLPGAVVKNVAFNDITLDKNASSGSVMASGTNLGAHSGGYKTIMAEISDVYISVGSSWFDKKWSYKVDEQTYYTNYTGILCSSTSAIDYKNVIVNIDAPDEYTYAPDLFYNGFYKKNDTHKAGFENVYVIGKSVKGTNEANTTDFYSHYAEEVYKTNVLDTVGFYENDSELTTAVTDLDSKFTSDCWTVKNGVPVWTTLIDDSIKISDNIVFSSWNGYGATDNDQKISCTEIEGNIQGVYYTTDINKENNLYNADTGKVNIVNLSNAVEYKKVVIVTDKNVYKATLEVYTRVITTVDELKMFNIELDKATTITGSYALGANIVDNSGFVFNENCLNALAGGDNKDDDWYTYGFAGTFDGKGHYITITVGTGGLFNQLLDGAVVKNLGMIDLSLDSAANSGVALAIGSNLYKYATLNGKNPITSVFVNIADTYISVNGTWFDKKWSTGKKDESGKLIYANYTGILVGDCANVDYKNVIVEIEVPKDDEGNDAEYTYAPDLLKQSLYNESSNAGFENVYVIGKSVEGTNANDTTDLYSYFAIDSVKSFVIEGISFYTDYDKFKTEVTNANTVFTNDCWLVIDGVPTWFMYNEKQ